MVTVATAFQDGALLLPLKCHSTRPAFLSVYTWHEYVCVCVCMWATQALVEAHYLKIDTSSVSVDI